MTTRLKHAHVIRWNDDEYFNPSKNFTPASAKKEFRKLFFWLPLLFLSGVCSGMALMMAFSS